jgi:hypothetical protein
VVKIGIGRENIYRMDESGFPSHLQIKGRHYTHVLQGLDVVCFARIKEGGLEASYK